MSIPRILEVRTSILKRNDAVARDLRRDFTRHGVLVVNMVSSPGTGKTEFLFQTLLRLRQHGAAVAAVVGDLETDNDARRLAVSGASVRQINTHGLCHLEADMIRAHVADWDLAGLDYLFIENVGNLVCPTSWDLGESLRLALLSVTEGEDKPLKYPALFNTADVVALTKLDLAAACGFDAPLARANIAAVRPGMPIVETSARTGAGLAAWLDLLAACRHRLLATAPT